MITIQKTLQQELDYEFVERKGKGHPDTICDAIAERSSRYYSKYFLDKYGRYAHHWFDKVMLIGGESIIKYGKGDLIKPFKVIVAGKCVKEVDGKKVPLDEIFFKAAKEELQAVLLYFDPKKHLIIYNETVDHQGSSRRGGRYRPNNIDELISRDNLERVSNDCNLLTAYAPLSILESLVLSIENHYTSQKFRKGNLQIGSDVKLVGVRKKDKYYLLVNMPFIADYIHSWDEYNNLSNKIKLEIQQKVLDEFNVECEVDFNPSDRENKPYLTSQGSAGDTGDVGVVGRGNRSNGLITPMRCMSIEAPAGKNPIDHTGKLYGIIATRIANKIYENFNTPVEVYIYVSKSTKLINPDEIIVNLQKKYITGQDNKVIHNIIEDQLAKIYSLTNELVNDGITMW